MRVLLTGAANWHGAALARRLAAEDDVEVVVALDSRRPPDDVLNTAKVTHLAADVRSPTLAREVIPHGVDTVVHNEVLQFSEPGRSARSLHDVNVIGTLGLLSACAGMAGLRTVVVRSSAAIYGAEPGAPAFFTEDMAERFPLRTRWQRDVRELERLTAAFARRHPQAACSMLRFQPVLAPGLLTPISALLTAPVVPRWLGYDPRIQVVSGGDATESVLAALRSRVRGPVNVAAEGAVALSRVLGRLRKPTVPLPPGAFGAVAALGRRLGLPPISEDTARYLRHGRGVDTTRLREEAGFVPRLSTMEAIVAAAAGHAR